MCLLPVDLLLASVFGEGRACSSGRQYQAHTKNRGRAPLLPGCHTAVAMRNNSLLYPCPASHRCSSSGTTSTNTQMDSVGGNGARDCTVCTPTYHPRPATSSIAWTQDGLKCWSVCTVPGQATSSIAWTQDESSDI